MEIEILERLIAHEVHCANFEDEIIRTPGAWFAAAPAVSLYQSANRAIRVRASSGNTKTDALQIAAFFKQRNMTAVVDLDSISEEQGVGIELRRIGITPVYGNTLWMKYAGANIAVPHNSEIEVVQFEKPARPNQIENWINTAVHEDIGTYEEDQWRLVLAREAGRSENTLYEARIDGEIAGACDIFCWDGWGRIDSVITLPKYRRQGVAAAMISAAVHESLSAGNSVTYLCTESGSPAESLYRKLGFEIWGVNIFRRHMG